MEDIKDTFSFNSKGYNIVPDIDLRINGNTVITAVYDTMTVKHDDHEQQIKLGHSINAILYRDGIIYVLVKQRDGFLDLHIYELADHELKLQRIIKLNIFTGICFVDIDSSAIIIIQNKGDPIVYTTITISCLDDIEITYEEGNKYYFTTQSKRICVPFYIYKKYIIGFTVKEGIIIAPIDNKESYDTVGKVHPCVNYRNSWEHLRFAD